MALQDPWNHFQKVWGSYDFIFLSHLTLAILNFVGICRWWRSATILLCRATKFRLQAVWAIAFLRSNLIQKLSRMSNGLWEILCIYTALFYSQTKQFPHLDWIFKFLSAITIINDLFVFLNVCTIYLRYHTFLCIGHHLLIS